MTSHKPQPRLHKIQHVMDFKDLCLRRRSHRHFTDEPVSKADIDLIIKAALLSPTSQSRRDWKFVVVTDKEKIFSLSEAKDHAAELLAEAPLAIVVAGRPEENDCWIEDCAVAAVTMQYQAEDLGLGSCWVQMRDRGIGDIAASSIISAFMGLKSDEEVLCVLAIGHKAKELPPLDESQLKYDSVKYI